MWKSVMMILDQFRPTKSFKVFPSNFVRNSRNGPTFHSSENIQCFCSTFLPPLLSPSRVRPPFGPRYSGAQVLLPHSVRFSSLDTRRGMLPLAPPFGPPPLSSGKDGFGGTTPSPRGCSLGPQYCGGGKLAGSADVPQQLGMRAAAAAPEGGGVRLSCGGEEPAKIVDFSPRWDFSAGGAKLLIVLAAPMSIEVGRQGPIVYFADRSVQVRLLFYSVW